MTILLGVTLGAAATLLLLLIPAIALRLTLRLFVEPSVRRPPPRRDQTGRGAVGDVTPRPFGTLRAAS